MSVQFIRLQSHTSFGALLPRLIVEGDGKVKAVYVEGHFGQIWGPRNGAGVLRIGMVDSRHQKDGRVEVIEFLSDSEIEAEIGPLSGRRQQRGPQDPSQEQRQRPRGYTP